MYALEGGSIGFQIGGEATDLILLVNRGRRHADLVCIPPRRHGGLPA
jgi:lipid-binding SYLF domain-containing protein